MATQGQWLPAATPTDLAVARRCAVDRPGEFFIGPDVLRSLHAKAPNTVLAYRSDWKMFVECCRLHGHSPLPASLAAIETFIEWRSPEQPALRAAGKYKYLPSSAPRRVASAATVARALTAIGNVHRWLAFPDPTNNQSVRDTLTINTAGRKTQGHKDPLLWDDLERAFARMGDSLWAIRDRALASVAYSTMFRRSELVALVVDDYHRATATSSARMAVRRTKTEDGKHQKYRHVSEPAADYLERWLRAAHITEGPLFRGITPDRKAKATALSAGEVARTFKAIARAADLPDIGAISGHSTRIGATHDLAFDGATAVAIQHDGGWKSPLMPSRYLQGFESDHGAMARMFRRRAGR